MDHSNHTLLQAGSQTAISDRMRELLARAAQDHVYEQRTQGAVLDEIRQRLEGMEWLLREVRERELGGLSGALEVVGAQLGELATRPPAWAEGLAQHVEIVRERVDGVGGRLAGIGDRVDSVGDRVRPVAELPGLLADLGAVREGVAESLKRVQALLDGGQAVPEHLGELARRLTRLHAAVEEAGGRFTRVDEALLDLSQRTDRLEGGVLDLNEGLEETLASAIERLTASVELLTGKVEGMTDELAGAESRLTGRLAGAEVRFTGLEERLDGVDGQLTGLQTRLGGLDERLGGLDQRLAGVDERVSGQDQRFTAIDDGFEGVNERLEMVDDRVEAVNQRVGQLPALLEVGEVHKRVGELISAQGDDHGGRLDTIDRRLTEAAGLMPPLADLVELVRARPDREQLSETVGEIVQPTRDDLTRRLGALEETMLALAEALLRPARTPKD
ncbi:hypothetical protein [Sphaerisporangium corydalis]|uniref:t-SNARE coiled-coil homology domain-containing protein n=1 Tax=Sphaerisporangium corydalis TaxID=1441875 RepID=A0ABV9ELY4_9ACTN|nr:hypothetical protein [Sphaerisporangium corydalis]